MTPRTKAIIGAVALVVGIVLGTLALGTDAVCRAPGGNVPPLLSRLYLASLGGTCGVTVLLGTVLFLGGAVMLGVPLVRIGVPPP